MFYVEGCKPTGL